MKKIITARKIFIKLYYRTKAIVFIGLFKFLSLFAKKSDYLVLCERGTDARDNAYAFYRYLKENYPTKKVYYIIDKNSADYPRVETDFVQYGSVKNYWVIARASKIISTHLAMFVPHLGIGVKKFLGLYKKFYWLQHGVTQAAIPNLSYKNNPMQLFVCTALAEYNFVQTTNHYPESVLKCTGMARYDNLLPFERKRQILIMPTWRAYILTQEKFLNSEYFRHWQNFLLDENLEKLLEEYNLELIFYPHYECQKYLKYFKCNSPKIILADFRKYDVQTLLKESSLLITDYSSVFFDFAYMKKPLLYFQFDNQEFFANHYSKGYFSYENMGFGDICLTEEELYLKVKDIVQKDFSLDKKYEKRVDDFFLYRDTKNCQRIYDEIMKNY